MIKTDFNTYLKDKDFKAYKERIKKIKNDLNNGGEMLDWYDIDKCISLDELNKIKDISKKIRKNCELFIVIGIGGSFLGAKAVITALEPYFEKNKPEIVFAGNSLSESYLTELLAYMENKDTIVNVISKSGTTLEPSIAFDIIYEKMQQKYNNDELKKRIIITTDPEKGILRKLANDNNYESFIVPEQIGGRYSVLTAVGLLPIAVAGFDIDKLLLGARSVNNESAFEYAITRDILYNQGKVIESFTFYEPKLEYFAEWLKQLFGETQGKNKKGIFPTSSNNTRDLHSLGQFYQDGTPIIFETIIGINKQGYLKSKLYTYSVEDINMIALKQVAYAHLEAGVESNAIMIDKLDEFNLGMLIYYFETAAAVGGYLINNINPFDQPGVAAYKQLIEKELKNSSLKNNTGKI